MKKGGSEEPPKPECFISYGCGVGGVGDVPLRNLFWRLSISPRFQPK